MQTQALYTYDFWLQESQALFKKPIEEQKYDFHPDDHKLSLKKNKDILGNLIELQNAFFKSIKLKELVKYVRHEVISLKEIHASSCILLERVKTCLETTGSIEFPPKSDAKWFQEILAKPDVKKGLSSTILMLDSRITHYKETQSTRPLLHI